MNGFIQGKIRALGIAATLFSLLAVAMPFAPVSRVHAVAPTFAVEGRQPNGLNCCAQGAFSDSTGRYVYSFSTSYTVMKVDRITGAHTDTGVPAGVWNYSEDGSMVWVRSKQDNMVSSIHLTTGVVSTHEITGADWQERGNPLALAAGTISILGSPTSVLIVLDRGDSYLGYKGGLSVIDATTFQVIAKYDWDYVTGAPLWAGYQLMDYVGSIELSTDGATLFASNNGVAYEIPTSDFDGLTLAGIGVAYNLIRGRTVGTSNLLYSFYGGSNGFVKVYDTATDTMVHEINRVSVPAYEEDPRAMMEAPNGDLYVAENFGSLVHLSKADSYSLTRVPLPVGIELPIGLAYSSYPADGDCVFVNNNSGFADVLVAVSVNGAKCGAFRSARFGPLPDRLAIDGTETLSINNDFSDSEGGTDADWVGLGVFLDGQLAQTISPVPSSLELNWTDLDTARNFEIRAYNAADLGGDALEDVDLDTQYVESTSMLIDFYPLAPSQLANGEEYTCGIVSDSAYCWGVNWDGQLGDGADLSSDPEKQLTPRLVDANDGFVNTDVSTLTTGLATVCAIESGKLYCWGDNDDGQVGTGGDADESLPQKVTSNAGFSNSNVTVVDTYDDATCAIESGSVYCWGGNYDGQLGNGSSMDASLVPVKVLNNPTDGFTNSGVTDIATASDSACAIKSGVVYCWGSDNSGQLGIDGNGSSNVPVKVFDHVAEGFTNTGITDIEAGSEHYCVVKSGSVFCWGYGSEGQLGNDDTDDSYVAVKVVANEGFTNTAVTALGLFDYNTCAVEAGALYCWGYNDDGQFGNDDSGSEEAPVKALDNPDGDFTNSNITGIAVGYGHNCVISDGKGYCAGEGDNGELGTGVRQEEDYFVPIFGWAVSDDEDSAIPGVTETDSTFYSNALPTEVAKMSTVKVLRPAARATKRLASKTKGVCLVARGRVVFLKAGTCRVHVFSRSTGNVVKRMRTTVSNRTVDEVGKGSAVVLSRKVMFGWESTRPLGMSVTKWRNLKQSVTRTGLVLVVGHTHIGKNAYTTKKFSADRARVVKTKVKKRGTKVAVRGMGGKYPLTRATSRAQQLKNERVMVYMIPTVTPPS